LPPRTELASAQVLSTSDASEAAKHVDTKPSPTPAAVGNTTAALTTSKPTGPDSTCDLTPTPDSPAKLPSQPKTTPAAVAPAVSKIDFHKQIKPLFEAHCFKCHDASKQKGEYRIDDREMAFVPGDSGEMPIVPGNADDSLLIKVLEGKGEYVDTTMPPKGTRLTSDQVALVKQWINEGADWPQ
jgi:cytochrome c5